MKKKLRPKDQQLFSLNIGSADLNHGLQTKKSCVHRVVEIKQKISKRKAKVPGFQASSLNKDFKYTKKKEEAIYVEHYPIMAKIGLLSRQQNNDIH